MNILILCTGNSARSILLEAIFDQLSDGRVSAYSAGSKPAGAVNPGSIALLKRKSMQFEHYTSKSWDVFAGDKAPKMDIVITVCGNARDEECPFWPGHPLRAHWGVEDPADVTTPPSAVQAAFEDAYDILKQRADAFLELDFAAIPHAELQKHLNLIATIGA